MSALAYQVATFREWAASRGLGVHSEAEWECDYPDWQGLYSAVDGFLAVASQRTVTQAELELLLYVLARDNEDERILEMLERFPKIALQLAEAAVRCPDANARWQAAVLAGHIRSVALVRCFLNDEAEYVRRRAGFVLQEMESGS